MINELSRSSTSVPLLPEYVSGPGGVNFDPAAAIDRELQGIVANFSQPVGTVYGLSREAELTDAERAAILPAATAAGVIAVGRYSVGPKQSEAAKARIAEHEAWVNSDARKRALAEVLMTQAIIDAQVHNGKLQEEVARLLKKTARRRRR